MSEHHHEYRELLAKVTQRDRESIEAHWELGELFARYGEPVAGIAMAIGRGVTFVADHIRIVQVIPSREDLARVLGERDDITTWTVLVDWVKAGGPGQETGEAPDANDISRARRGSRGQPSPQGGLQLTVPAHIIKALADRNVNQRECLNRFWRNVSVDLIVEIAYAGVYRQPATPVSVPFTEAAMSL